RIRRLLKRRAGVLEAQYSWGKFLRPRSAAQSGAEQASQRDIPLVSATTSEHPIYSRTSPHRRRSNSDPLTS
ncbi:MAG: hypothetical protein ABIY56_06090, partial [Dokdonella sp.]